MSVALRALLAAVVVPTLLTCCADSSGSSDAPECTTNADCETGELCNGGFCFPDNSPTEGAPADADSEQPGDEQGGDPDTDTVDPVDADTDTVEDEDPGEETLDDADTDVGDVPDRVDSDVGPDSDIGPTGDCEFDDDCPGLQRCTDTVCAEPLICLGDVDCLDERRCLRAECSSQPEECSASTACATGVCDLSGDECVNPDSCGGGSECVSGVCGAEADTCLPCIDDEDCGSAGWSCAESGCEQTSECTGSADCICGLVCSEGLCAAPDEGATEDSPNDSPAAAIPLSSGEVESEQTGPGDVDWWRLQLAPGEGALIRVETVSGCGTVRARAWSNTALHPLAVDARALRYELLALPPSSSAQNVLVAVEATGASVGHYRIAAELSDQIGCLLPFDSPDPLNDGPATAVPLPLPGPFVEATLLCGGDERWYSVENAGLATLAAWVSSPATGAAEARWYDLELNPIGTDFAAPSFASSVVANASPGSYLLRLTNPEGETPTSVTGVWRADPGLCIYDGLEVDDSFFGANPVGLGALTSATLCTGDEDWFVVDTPSTNNAMVLRATYQTPGAQAKLAVFDADLTPVAEVFGTIAAIGAEGVAELSLEAHPEIAERWVRVSLEAGPTDGTVPYAFEAFELDTSCIDDDLEPNDALDEATELSTLPGSSVGATLCPGDEDWFQLEMEPPARVTVDLSSMDSVGGLDAALQAPGGVAYPVAVAPTPPYGVIATAELDETAPSGDWRLVWSSPTAVDYSISAIVADPEACDSDDGEPDDTPLSAPWIGESFGWDGIFCPANPDCRRVEVVAGGPPSELAVETLSPAFVSWRVVPLGGATLAEGSVISPGAADLSAIDWLPGDYAFCVRALSGAPYSIELLFAE